MVAFGDINPLTNSRMAACLPIAAGGYMVARGSVCLAYMGFPKTLICLVAGVGLHILGKKYKNETVSTLGTFALGFGACELTELSFHHCATAVINGVGLIVLGRILVDIL
jgi:hypothetical protein